MHFIYIFEYMYVYARIPLLLLMWICIYLAYYMMRIILSMVAGGFLRMTYKIYVFIVFVLARCLASIGFGYSKGSSMNIVRCGELHSS